MALQIVDAMVVEVTTRLGFVAATASGVKMGFSRCLSKVIDIYRN